MEGHDIGGTCVNRGCVPSKALLAASNEVRRAVRRLQPRDARSSCRDVGRI